MAEPGTVVTASIGMANDDTSLAKASAVCEERQVNYPDAGDIYNDPAYIVG